MHRVWWQVHHSCSTKHIIMPRFYGHVQDSDWRIHCQRRMWDIRWLAGNRLTIDNFWQHFLKISWGSWNLLCLAWFGLGQKIATFGLRYMLNPQSSLDSHAVPSTVGFYYLIFSPTCKWHPNWLNWLTLLRRWNHQSTFSAQQWMDARENLQETMPSSPKTEQKGVSGDIPLNHILGF